MNAEIDQKHLKDALAYYIEELAASVPQAKECEGITFSPRFKKRMERMIRDHQKTFYFWFNTAGKRVASVILAVVVAVSAGALSVKAVRESLVKLAMEFFDTFAILRIDYEGVDVPKSIDPVEPSYIPAGFSRRHFSGDDSEYWVEYCDPSGDPQRELSYRQEVIDDSGRGIHTEEMEYRAVFINGYEGLIAKRNGRTSVLFVTEKYVFTVSGTVSEAEVIKVAESIPLRYY